MAFPLILQLQFIFLTFLFLTDTVLTQAQAHESSSSINPLKSDYVASLLTNSTPPPKPQSQSELSNILKLFPKPLRFSARSYIASKLKKIVLIPAMVEDSSRGPSKENLTLTFDLTTLPEKERKSSLLFGFGLEEILKNIRVPIIPEDASTSELKWVPGELIAHHITKREIQILNESPFGPLRSVTMFPSVMSSILVFEKRHHPEILARVLKYYLGIEAEPNGVILEV